MTVLFYCTICGGSVDAEDVPAAWDYDRDGPICATCAREPRWAKPDDSWAGEPTKLLLCCPTCHSCNAHHQHVEEFVRVYGEDSQTVLLSHGTVRGSDDNPSSRRDAIRIHFHGECSHAWYLDIVQHKGETFVSAHANGETPDAW